MLKFYNINRQIRIYLAQQLEKFYNETQDKTEALAQYYQFFEQLKFEHGETYYKMVLGLCFSDACRILHFFNLYNQLSKEKQEWLKRFDKFQSFTDLEALIEEDPSYLSMMMQAPLKMQLFPLRDQASMLLLSTRITDRFDLFHEFEKNEVFQAKNLDMIRKMYENNMKKEEMWTDPANIAFEQLMILSIGNTKEFFKTLAVLLREYYKVNKALEVSGSTFLTDLGKQIIVKIEYCSFEELLYMIAYDEDCIKEILTVYLSIISLLEDDLENIYETNAPEHVKKKLKEV